ncbi:hypothetical protein RHS03_01360, partial [Rhizoctonia solani]
MQGVRDSQARWLAAAENTDTEARFDGPEGDWHNTSGLRAELSMPVYDDSVESWAPEINPCGVTSPFGSGRWLIVEPFEISPVLASFTSDPTLCS